jgi:membrane protease YdiL (CAAX protease family)
MGVIAVTILLSVSPALKARRPVVFKYSRRELFISLGLYALVLIATVLYSGGYIRGLVPYAPAVGDAFTFTPEDLVRQALLCVVLAAPFVLALVIRRQPWLSAGLAKTGMRAGWQMGLGLGLITVFLTGKTYAILDGFTQAEVWYLLAALITAFAQEFVFRGFIQLRLVNSLGATWGWIATAILFTLWRLPEQIFLHGISFASLGWNIFLVLGMGLILGWVMRKSGNILAPGLYHALHIWVQVL